MPVKPSPGLSAKAVPMLSAIIKTLIGVDTESTVSRDANVESLLSQIINEDTIYAIRKGASGESILIRYLEGTQPESPESENGEALAAPPSTDSDPSQIASEASISSAIFAMPPIATPS